MLKKMFGTIANASELMLVTLAMFFALVVYRIGVIAYDNSLIADGANIFAALQGNPFEFWGTFMLLICVWLSRTENVWTWPTGIIGTALIGYFFWTIGLPGQMALNWLYFLPISFVAWYWWVFGGENKTELKVTTLTWSGRLLMVVAIGSFTAAVYNIINYIVPGSSYPLLDSTVVASSIVAQVLLGRKKLETWILWFGPVNALSVALFYLTGAYTVMALYVAFFVHAGFAIRSWDLEARRNRGMAMIKAITEKMREETFAPGFESGKTIDSWKGTVDRRTALDENP